MNAAQPLCEVLEPRVLLAADDANMCPAWSLLLLNETVGEPVCPFCEHSEDAPLAIDFLVEGGGTSLKASQENFQLNTQESVVETPSDGVSSPPVLVPSNTQIIDQYAEKEIWWKDLWVQFWNKVASFVYSDD
ncbi:MAG TPA: hypothetical protein DIU37_04035 [Opitutae bacterium]|nr:hypothetical protein [Opitutae bacterium]|tara:strand:+ start:1133 stop:1531 length:399 start_codon:yes stop_codon:yes gene_type:complete